MLVLKLLFLAYLLSSIVTILLVNSAIDRKGFRLIFWGFGLIMPLIFGYAILVSLFKRSRVVPFNEELAKMEDAIELERVRLFGGEITCPSFSNRWQQAYDFSLQRVLHTAAKAQEKMVSIQTHIHLGRAA